MTFHGVGMDFFWNCTFQIYEYIATQKTTMWKQNNTKTTTNKPKKSSPRVFSPVLQQPWLSYRLHHQLVAVSGWLASSSYAQCDFGRHCHQNKVDILQYDCDNVDGDWLTIGTIATTCTVWQNIRLPENSLAATVDSASVNRNFFLESATAQSPQTFPTYTVLKSAFHT